MKKENLSDKQKKIIEEAEIINKSVEWWYKQMDDIMGQMDRAKSEKLLAKLQSQLDTLIAKGDLEIKNIAAWRVKKNKLKNEKRN